MTAGGVQRRLQVSQDRHPEFLFGFALAHENRAVLNIGPAHFQNVPDPLARADAQLHHKPFSGADRAGRSIGVQKLLRPWLTLCLYRFQFGDTPRRVGICPSQIDAVFHQHPQHAQRIVREVRFVGVRVPKPNDVLALKLGRVAISHDRQEEIEMLVVVQTRAGLQVPIPRRLVVALNQSVERSGRDDARLVLGGKNVGVFLPKLRRPELVFEFLGRPAAPLEVEAIALPVDVFRKLTFCHTAYLSPRTRQDSAPSQGQAQSSCLL